MLTPGAEKSGLRYGLDGQPPKNGQLVGGLGQLMVLPLLNGATLSLMSVAPTPNVPQMSPGLRALPWPSLPIAATGITPASKLYLIGSRSSLRRPPPVSP